jgi:hypothetical protein
VVAWQEGTSTSASKVVLMPVQLTAGNTLTTGATTSFGGLSAFEAGSPTVGYSQAKAWIGYWSNGTTVGSTKLNVAGFDSATCASCFDTFSQTITGTERRIVVATMASGGATGDDALAVWENGGDILGQRLRNHGNGGTTMNLGGACGNAGLQAFSHNPAIGAAGFTCYVNWLPPGALLTVFNFSAPGTPVPCGACSWNPFSITLTPPIIQYGASVSFPIPCQMSLIGAQFETQWTTIDGSQAPCPVSPGWVMTDRQLLTIGQ